MYIFHKPLPDYVGQPLLAALNIDVSKSVSMSGAYVAAGTLVTYVVALASWHAFEKHFLKLKRFFRPKQ